MHKMHNVIPINNGEQVTNELVKVIDDYFPPWLVDIVSKDTESMPVKYTNSPYADFEKARFFGTMLYLDDKFQDLPYYWFIDYFNRCESFNVNTPRFQYSTDDQTPTGKYNAHIQDKLNSIGPDKSSYPDQKDIGPTSYGFVIEQSGILGKIFNNAIHACYDVYSKKYFNLRTFDTQIYNSNIQRTLPGQGYHVWHCENEHMYRASNPRVLAVMMYLNDVNDGGETEFIFQHK